MPGTVACQHLGIPEGILCMCDCDDCTTRLTRDCVCPLCACDVVDHNEWVRRYVGKP